MPTYKLTYFNVRGRGEIVRLTFAAAGVAYEDCRIEFADKEQWAALKPTTPFGQIPVLEIDGGVKLCQSYAISRYIARLHGLAGKTDLDQARADMIVDCLEDVFKPIMAFYFEADETKKASLKKTYLEETLPKFLTSLEALLVANKGGDGYFVGDGLTWADLAFFQAISWVEMAGGNLNNFPKLAALVKRVESQPKVAKWLKDRPQTAM